MKKSQLHALLLFGAVACSIAAAHALTAHTKTSTARPAPVDTGTASSERLPTPAENTERRDHHPLRLEQVAGPASTALYLTPVMTRDTGAISTRFSVNGLTPAASEDYLQAQGVAVALECPDGYTPARASRMEPGLQNVCVARDGRRTTLRRIIRFTWDPDDCDDAPTPHDEPTPRDAASTPHDEPTPRDAAPAARPDSLSAINLELDVWMTGGGDTFGPSPIVIEICGGTNGLD